MHSTNAVYKSPMSLNDTNRLSFPRFPPSTWIAFLVSLLKCFLIRIDSDPELVPVRPELSVVRHPDWDSVHPSMWYTITCEKKSVFIASDTIAGTRDEVPTIFDDPSREYKKPGTDLTTLTL